MPPMRCGEGTDLLGGSDPESPSRIERCILRVAEGEPEDVGRTMVLERGTVRIGQGETCELMLHDSAVSREHVELSVMQNGIEVRDLNSTNGTFYLGQRLQRAVLKPGVRITLGRSALDLIPAWGEPTADPRGRSSYGELVGTSVAMQQLYARLERLEGTTASVLINGETGTGKELVARAIHGASPRSAAPFLVVDCGNLNSELVGSALFGHKRGAFTGAASDQQGAFEAADGGTLFLDEIGDLPLDLQPRLLRVLENNEVVSIGETRATKVDVRVLAATHHNLEERIAAGFFREDLFYRLAVITLETPSLRARREDIPLLIDRLARHLGAEPGDIPVVARDFMVRQPWPGNVRELRNAVERILVLGNMGLPQVDSDAGPRPNRPDAGIREIDTSVRFHQAKQRAIEDFETAYLAELLRLAEGNISKAARSAGLDRKHLRSLLKRRGLYGSEGRQD